MPLGSLREALGAYGLWTATFTFNSDAVAGSLGYYGADFGAVAAQAMEMPFPGFVAAASVTALGGNLADASFVVQVETVAIAASAFAPGAVATGYKVYKPTDVPYVAGNSLALELDVITTMRDLTVTLWLAHNLSGY